MKKTRLFFLLLPVLFLMAACRPQPATPKLTIAISKGKPLKYYAQYSQWLQKADSTIHWMDMYHTSVDSALMQLENCSGLLLSGGADIYPGRYGKEADTARCGSFDLHRDTLELALIKKAQELGLPIMGICRGQQVLNVAMGGTLYIDLPSDLDTTVTHRLPDTYECYHPIDINQVSMLGRLSGKSRGTVNSNHHQGIEQLALNLRVIARSPDGLPEAIQYHDAGNKPFLLAMQWHPERLNTESPFSLPLAKAFIKEARAYFEQQIAIKEK